MLDPSQISAALDRIDEDLTSGTQSLEQYSYTDDEYAKGSGEWQLQLAYTELLVLSEALGMPVLRAEIASVYADAQKDIAEMKHDPEGDPYSVWAGPARRFVRALQTSLAVEPSHTITKDIESILRAATYSITDPAVFPAAPQSEAELHVRVEAVLRCVFPDLVTKPRLGKAIKNFEPDTGLPSIETLIEYKYASEKAQIPSIADEILADTRGYSSKEWKVFIYAIYETKRFRPEAEWRQLLRQSGVPETATVVVMSGEPRASSAGRKRAASKRAR